MKNHCLTFLTHRFHLSHGLCRKQSMEVFVVRHQFVDGRQMGIGTINQLTDAGRVIHGFMFQRTQTVVHDIITDVQLLLFIFCSAQLILRELNGEVLCLVECHTILQRMLDLFHDRQQVLRPFRVSNRHDLVQHLQFRLVVLLAQQHGVNLFNLLQTETIMDEMTVIEEIVGHENEQEEEDEQDHGNRLVRLRPLHDADIRFEAVVSRLLLIQLRIYLIIILIQLSVV